MNLFSRQTFKKLVKVIIVTLIFLFLFKMFFLETYLLHTSQMAVTLQEGDRVLVNKISYGARMPKSILGKELPDIRLFADQVNMGDVVLFNSPYQSTKPLDKRELLISRCVGLPGDTIVWDGIDYTINGKTYQSSLNSVRNYIMAVSDTSIIQKLADENDIKLEWGVVSDEDIVFKISKAEASILKDENENLFHSIKSEKYGHPIYLILPHKGDKLKLSRNNIELYKQVLLYENRDDITIENQEVHLKGELLDSYTFQNDYYWFLSDNVSNSIDSRSLGFIPFTSVVGEVSCILYNTNSMGRSLNIVN